MDWSGSEVLGPEDLSLVSEISKGGGYLAEDWNTITTIHANGTDLILVVINRGGALVKYIEDSRQGSVGSQVNETQ